MEFLYVLGLIFVVFSISFALLNLKLFIKGEEYKGSCASKNPHLEGKVEPCVGCDGTSSCTIDNS